MVGKNDGAEYPFDLGKVFVYQLGYPSIAKASGIGISTKFSLHTSGLLGRKSCPILLVNGMEDSVFPSEDTWIGAQHVRPKDVRAVLGAGHMGRLQAEGVLNEWLVKRLVECTSGGRK